MVVIKLGLLQHNNMCIIFRFILCHFFYSVFGSYVGLYYIVLVSDVKLVEITAVTKEKKLESFVIR